MIERYSRPEMAAIWTDKGKLDRWLAVEIAVVDAWADAGRVPRADAEKVRGASFNVDDIARFVASVAVIELGFGTDGKRAGLLIMERAMAKVARSTLAQSDVLTNNVHDIGSLFDIADHMVRDDS